MVKPSELVHSVHAYLLVTHAKAAKALGKEALLASQAAPATTVDVAAAVHLWAKKAKKKRDRAPRADDVDAAVHAFLASCALAKSAKAVRKAALAGESDDDAPPLLDAAAAFLKKQGKKTGSAGAAAPKTPEAPAPATKKAKKRKRSASEDLRQEEARTSAEKKKRDDAAAAMDAWLAKQATAAPPASAKKAKSPRSPGTPFERIDSAKWMAAIKDDRMKDNSYAAQFGDGGWGATASAKLLTVQGKRFQHEKTKKKRGGYRGGTVDMGSNSIKFAD